MPCLHPDPAGEQRRRDLHPYGPLLFTRELKQRPGKTIWLEGGGELLDAFIKEKPVDEAIVTIAPVLLGSGIPLVRENAFLTALRLKSLRRFNQFAELHYEAVR